MSPYLISRIAGAFASATMLCATLSAGPAVAAGEVNLYSFRQPFLIEIGRAHV